MGRKSKTKGKASQSLEGGAAPVDRGTLAQCLNATSQIAAECNSILRDLLRGRWVLFITFCARVQACLSESDQIMSHVLSHSLLLPPILIHHHIHTAPTSQIATAPGPPEARQPSFNGPEHELARTAKEDGIATSDPR